MVSFPCVSEMPQKCRLACGQTRAESLEDLYFRVFCFYQGEQYSGYGLYLLYFSLLKTDTIYQVPIQPYSHYDKISL